MRVAIVGDKKIGLILERIRGTFKNTGIEFRGLEFIMGLRTSIERGENFNRVIILDEGIGENKDNKSVINVRKVIGELVEFILSRRSLDNLEIVVLVETEDTSNIIIEETIAVRDRIAIIYNPTKKNNTVTFYSELISGKMERLKQAGYKRKLLATEEVQYKEKTKIVEVEEEITEDKSNVFKLTRKEEANIEDIEEFNEEDLLEIGLLEDANGEIENTDYEEDIEDVDYEEFEDVVYYREDDWSFYSNESNMGIENTNYEVGGDDENIDNLPEGFGKDDRDNKNTVEINDINLEGLEKVSGDIEFKYDNVDGNENEDKIDEIAILDLDESDIIDLETIVENEDTLKIEEDDEVDVVNEYNKKESTDNEVIEDESNNLISMFESETPRRLTLLGGGNKKKNNKIDEEEINIVASDNISYKRKNDGVDEDNNNKGYIAKLGSKILGKSSEINNNKKLDSKKETKIARREEDNKLKSLTNRFLYKGNTMVVTGTQGVGKTTTTYGIANTMLDMGMTCLIVDMDTRGRGQTYISREAYEAIHSTNPDNFSLRQALNAPMEVQRFVNVLKPGLHTITMGLASNITEVQRMVPEEKLIRFDTSIRNLYNFIIYDVPINVLTKQTKGILYNAEQILVLSELSTYGAMNLMIEMSNIDDIEAQETLFNRGIICNSKYRKNEKITVLGQEVNNISSLLVRVDETIVDLMGIKPDYYFSNMRTLNREIKYLEVLKNIYWRQYDILPEEISRIYKEILVEIL